MTFPGQDRDDVQTTVFQARILAVYADEDIGQRDPE
jgi:hypothetical protein